MSKQVIFMHIPKTAGASIGHLCMSRGFGAVGHDIRRPGYVSLAMYKSAHPDIFSFTIVRNPWDRVVSAYHYLSQGGLNAGDREDAERFVARYDDFNAFVAGAFQDGSILAQMHFRPQYEWISDGDVTVVDYIGYFESLQQDVSGLLARLGMEDYRLPHVNKADHQHYTQYYSADSADIIGTAYARDIEMFGYGFGTT